MDNIRLCIIILEYFLMSVESYYLQFINLNILLCKFILLNKIYEVN